MGQWRITINGGPALWHNVEAVLRRAADGREAGPTRDVVKRVLEAEVTFDESYTQPRALTGKQMCEVIAADWQRSGEAPTWWDGTPEGIWNYSPTGELSALYGWYERAKVRSQPKAAKEETP